MERHRDYCKSNDTREDIFRMNEGENEMLEYFKRGSNSIINEPILVP